MGMLDLRETLEKNKEYYIKRLAELVEIDTHVLGHGIDGGLEKEGQDYLAWLLREMGARLRLDPLREADIKRCHELWHEGNLGHKLEKRYNLYAGFGTEGRGRSLILNGHMDVMPADNEKEWKSPPFEPRIEGGRMYGRGTADMKAGLMASVMAVQLLKDAEREIPGELIIASVCDEEGGGNGSIQALMSGLRADGVVVCEGTGDELILAHMGFVFFRVEVEGKSCHSGEKKAGVSAIEKAIKIIEAMHEMEHEWLLKYRHPLLPSPSLNVGVIRGGSAGSTVPSECCFELCVHYIPGQMNYQGLVGEIEDLISRVSRSDLWLEKHPPKLTVYQAGGGFEMGEGQSLVESFQRAYSLVRKKPVQIAGSPAGCDSRLWRNIGGCQTIQFGPGNLAQCHSTDEWVEIDSYLESILIYAELILDFCAA